MKFDDALRELDEEGMKTAKGKERWRGFILPVSFAVPDATRIGVMDERIHRAD